MIKRAHKGDLYHVYLQFVNIGIDALIGIGIKAKEAGMRERQDY